MKSLIVTFICFMLFTSIAEAYTAYYYYGQYFKITSPNTVELIKPIKADGNMTLKKEYNGNFIIQDIIPIDNKAYFVTKIADSAFDESKITSLTIGEYIDSIGESACANCKFLKMFNSNAKLTYIGSRAFEGCSNLSNIILPNGLKYIGDRAFSNCLLSDELSIPSSVTSIGICSFFGTNIHTLSLSSQKLSIGEYAFAQANKLEVINIASLTNWCNYKFETIYSNPLYYARVLTLNGEPIVDLDLTSEQIISIPEGAFLRQTSIKKVKLGATLKTISSKSFYTSSIISINILAEIPPKIEKDSFTHSTYANAILTVPFGCVQVYKNSSFWSSFSNIVEAEDKSSNVDTNIFKESIHINNRNISASKPVFMKIYTIDGKCLYNDVTDSYTFESPGIYIVNGSKYNIM